VSTHEDAKIAKVLPALAASRGFCISQQTTRIDPDTDTDPALRISRFCGFLLPATMCAWPPGQTLVSMQ